MSFSAHLDTQLYQPMEPPGNKSSTPAATEVRRELGEAVSRESTKRTPGGELVRPKSRRLPHNLIERRYRDNLNHQIEVLRNELPTFKSIIACTEDTEDAVSLAGKWPSKAVIIAAAVQYIGELEQQRTQAGSRTTVLIEQVVGLQKLVRCDDCAIMKYMEDMQSQVLGGQ
ncbi:hypothetical protein LTR56_015598 [Elasticomyces elasticus]|nr:hypothetical protein LTR56_015598 [Elasticomyces elasticus]KAK3652526.1 hypothetical protein LTR22_011613 [Elasticomyces elasticus]KAK4919231.1 hypothetical protein LTR49_013078 [Elasticomyces elasticus]KAK5757788.1 hypothetical protein LTS12_012106 [Elasticomyces elasticus]